MARERIQSHFIKEFSSTYKYVKHPRKRVKEPTKSFIDVINAKPYKVAPIYSSRSL